MKKLLLHLFYIFFPLIIGGIVAFMIKDSIDYTSLIKPPLAPPKILFPIAWSIIYFLMGFSYFIYKKKYKEFNIVNIVYYLQLFVNAMWSIIFFIYKARFIAIFWIILLDVLVIYLIYLFSQKEKISAYLNILYLLWILFATYLTIGIYLLNL